ncbi:nucleoside hydrolase [Sphingobium sp.]|uniref:nucleoside hydrolase n=1 Tax=Sphingobium sp. TaxID=1912891 RepID=UPI002617B852|nr:nucleoside hydrolase [Sphingobium sp.]
MATHFSKRDAIRLLGAAAVLPLAGAARATGAVRMRTIIDNDFGGDPDGLFQLAHHALSPSVEIPLVISSHLHPNESWIGDKQVAAGGAREANALLDLLALSRRPTVIAGAEAAIAGRSQWKPSAATAAIVREAMRSDTTMPLYYCAGASLTELALAWLVEPRIASRMILVWIGGGEYPGVATPAAGAATAEYNLTIDTIAAQIIFNESDFDIWQVPRDAYRQLLFSNAELAEVGAAGKVGAYLNERVMRIPALLDRKSNGKMPGLGETYIMGDSPLVTLTALQSSFQPDPSSSDYVLTPCPRITDDGLYQDHSAGRRIRVYRRIDVRLTFADMIAKFRKAG